jgi:hypothetical protein
MQLSMHLPISFPKEAYEYGRRSLGETHAGSLSLSATDLFDLLALSDEDRTLLSGTA